MTELSTEERLARIDELLELGAIDETEHARLREWILSGRPDP